jgi:ABC-type antimicrobial peptide transport system permease subunit
MLSVNAIILFSFMTQADALNQTALYEIADEVKSESGNDLEKLYEAGKSKRKADLQREVDEVNSNHTSDLELFEDQVHTESKKKIQEVVDAKNSTSNRHVQKLVVDVMGDKDLKKLIDKAYDKGGAYIDKRVAGIKSKGKADLHKLVSNLESEGNDDVQKLVNEVKSKGADASISKDVLNQLVEQVNDTMKQNIQQILLDSYLKDKDELQDTEEEVYEQGKQDVHKVLDEVYSNATNDLQELQQEVESTKASHSHTATLFTQMPHKMIDPALVLIGLVVGSLMMFAVLRLRLSDSTALEEPLLAAGLGRTATGLSCMTVA